MVLKSAAQAQEPLQSLPFKETFWMRLTADSAKSALKPYPLSLSFSLSNLFEKI